jgi:NAD(P)H-hydrate repair Nnr-like enzyme with NAD(P)H-hydrate epimerase domain
MSFMVVSVDVSSGASVATGSSPSSPQAAATSDRAAIAAIARRVLVRFECEVFTVMSFRGWVVE